MQLTIYLGADHAGFALKKRLKLFLKKLGYKVIDMGADKFVPTDDYPDYAYKVAKAVARLITSRGIIICGSSQGVCIVANKVRGVHAAYAPTVKEAKLSRQHGNTNVLCLSGWYLKTAKAFEIVKTWLETPFSKEERHIRRLKKIAAVEKKEFK